MSKLKMYIPIRDENNFMIKFYQYLYNKFWGGMDVYFLGYTNPDFQLEKNIHFISLAKKRDLSPKSWSTKLIDFFESINDEFFYFSLEDYLVIRPVNHNLLDTCEDLLTHTIGRIDLWNSVQLNRPNSLVETFTYKGFRFATQSQNALPLDYRISSSNSIWNRNWLLKTLPRDWSTNDWEVKGNDGRNNNDSFEVLTTIDTWTPSVVHALSERCWGEKINIDGMYDNDIDKLKELSDVTDRCTEFFKFKEFNQVLNLKGYQPK